MSVLSDPTAIGVSVTPSDSADIKGGQRTRGLYVGGSGNLAIRMDEGDITFVGVVGGNVYPFRTKRVLLTGTTATNIIALF